MTRWKLGAGLAAFVGLLLVSVGDARAYRNGITGYTGYNGQYCKNCHGGPFDPSRADLVVDGVADPATYAFSPTVTYPVTIKFCAGDAMSGGAGFNIGVTGAGQGGLVALPAGTTDAQVSGREIRHLQRRAPTAASFGQGVGCTQEVRIQFLWTPPALAQDAANTQVKIAGASNWGPQNGGKTTVLTRNLGLDHPTACVPGSSERCGRTVNVAPLPCNDDDNDGHVPTTCYANGDNGGGDCDDTRQDVFPGALEVCDGVDNDCDGQTDENFASSAHYPDVDTDGYGDATAQPQVSCTGAIPPGRVTNNGDCNDLDEDVHPGAAELCDARDDDCDGQTDENYALLSNGVPRQVGESCDTEDVDICDHGTVVCVNNSLSECQGDTSQEEVCDGVDNDCDGQTDENAWLTLNDGTRLYAGTPCDSNTDLDRCPNGVVTCTSPNSVACEGDVATPERCDGQNVDNDCDGIYDKQDGWPLLGEVCGGSSCGTGRFVCAPSGTTVMCQDQGQPTETCGNSRDDDCDGETDELDGATWNGIPYGDPCDEDTDLDRCVTGTVACAGGYIQCVEPEEFPELCGNGQDDDCDGATDETCDGGVEPSDAGTPLPDAATPRDAGFPVDAAPRADAALPPDAAPRDAGPVDASLPADAAEPPLGSDGGDATDGNQEPTDARAPDAFRAPDAHVDDDAGADDERDGGRKDSARRPWPSRDDDDPPADNNPFCTCAATSQQPPGLELLLLALILARRRHQKLGRRE
ncbi:MAG: putative metal-binding motif-containing protein [Myxococcota bacterium]